MEVRKEAVELELEECREKAESLAEQIRQHKAGVTQMEERIADKKSEIAKLRREHMMRRAAEGSRQETEEQHRREKKRLETVACIERGRLIAGLWRLLFIMLVCLRD